MLPAAHPAACKEASPGTDESEAIAHPGLRTPSPFLEPFLEVRNLLLRIFLTNAALTGSLSDHAVTHAHDNLIRAESLDEEGHALCALHGI
jgi:hypothetical protein